MVIMETEMKKELNGCIDIVIPYSYFPFNFTSFRFQTISLSLQHEVHFQFS